MALQSREVQYAVPPRFATIMAVGRSRPKTPNSERVRLWQQEVQPGALAVEALPTEEPLPLHPMLEKNKTRPWRRLADTLHQRKRNKQAFAIELQSEKDCLDEVSLTFQSARSGITDEKGNAYTTTMPLSSPLHSGWEEQSKKGRARVSNGTIEALPPIPSYMLQNGLKKERIVQKANGAMDPAGMVLYDFLGMSGKI